jgi:cyclopropane-fatty-acyl-phospholipid synthase
VKAYHPRKFDPARIRAVGENQSLIRCDVCDHLPAWNIYRRSAQVAAPGFGGDDRFIRMWEYYLAEFEASFRSYGLAVFQIHLIKNIDAVPLTRGYMYENKGERTSNWKIIAAVE